MVDVKEKDTATGVTTVNTWKLIHTITNASRFSEITMILRNSSVANTLDYKIVVEVYDMGIEYTITEAEMLKETNDKITLNNSYENIKLYIKPETNDAHVNYIADYIGQLKFALPIGV